jgi:hypothetical protein
VPVDLTPYDYALGVRESAEAATSVMLMGVIQRFPVLCGVREVSVTVETSFLA